MGDKSIGKQCAKCKRTIKHEVIKSETYKIAGKNVILKVWSCLNCGTTHTTRRMV